MELGLRSQVFFGPLSSAPGLLVLADRIVPRLQRVLFLGGPRRVPWPVAACVQGAARFVEHCLHGVPRAGARPNVSGARRGPQGAENPPKTRGLIYHFILHEVCPVWVLEGILAGFVWLHDMALELVCRADFWCNRHCRTSPVVLEGLCSTGVGSGNRLVSGGSGALQTPNFVLK